MKQILSKKTKISILILLLISLGIYLFFLFLPLPSPLRTGLDPSWQYGISKAAENGLFFGKDIIFTFGSLGYLLIGATLENESFLMTMFMSMVYIIFFILVIIKIIKLKTNSEKISLIFCLVLALILGLTIDYIITIIFLLILSFEDLIRRSLRWWSLGLGILAGFCLLTKFTLGIYTFGALILFLVGEIYQAIRAKTRITSTIFALINALLAAISVSFIFLAPDLYLSKFFTLIVALIISTLAGFSFWFIQKKRVTINEEQTKKHLFSDYKNLNSVSWLIFYSVYALLLLSIIVHSFPSLIDYLKNSLEISSGYSSAMSFIPARSRLAAVTVLLAIFEFSLIFALLILIARERHIGFALASLLTLFLGFKHGFVRQDSHIIAFAVIAIFLPALCLTKIRKNSLSRFHSLLRINAVAIFIVCYMNLYINFPEALFVDIKYKLDPSIFVNKISSLLNLDYYLHTVQETSSMNLSRVKLPTNVNNLVQGKTIDIIPWEISLVATNNLNWKPRPIFQSYSAYTTILDNINFESLSRHPRDYIFYHFSSIDRRHQFFDEPQTFAYVFCNYQPSSVINDFINTPALSNIILLEKFPSTRCSSSIQGETISIPWNSFQSIKTTDNTIIRANIKIQYSFLGKIYKTIFRAPPVMMEVNYLDGFSEKYRIIPENSENGVIVSHLPRDDNEAMSFFQGQLFNPVKSFSFHTSNPLLYKPNINISFSSQLLR